MAGIVFVFTAWSIAAAEQYDITKLGTLGGERSRVSQIHNQGMVAGGSSIENSAWHAFRWDAGLMVDLGVPGDYLVSSATALNSKGRITGYANGEYQSQYAYLWENGDWTYLGTLPGEGLDYSVATDINDNSQICGYSFTVGPGSGRRAWIWENGIMTDLGTLGGERGSASAISELGQVVGYSQVYDPEDYVIHAFVWENESVTDLGVVPGEVNSAANDINENGQVVGYCSHQMETYPFLTIYRPCLWDNGQIIDLGIPEGYDRGVATGINNDGTIVAWMDTSLSGGPSYAFVWRGGEWEDLNSLIEPNSGWKLQAAIDVNDAGQIIGNGIAPGGSTQGFLLTPILIRAGHIFRKKPATELIETINYPNPFNASTTIEFELTHTSLVELDIFDLSGQRAANLLDSELRPGSHRISWDAIDKPSGVYFYRLKVGGSSMTGRMVLLK